MRTLLQSNYPPVAARAKYGEGKEVRMELVNKGSIEETLELALELVQKHQSSGVVYLVLEAIGNIVRAPKSEGLEQRRGELLRRALMHLTFVLARRASHSLMREAVDFYTPSVDETAESHARFRDAMQRFNRIVSAYAGLVYWNEAKEHVFMVQGGPLYHDGGLLTKAVAYEFEKIEREVRRHPELFLDEETATQFQFNSKIFPATPVHAAA